MYNDTIKAENKIISQESLTQIFQMMGDILKKYQNISASEEKSNHMLDYAYQSYTFKDDGSRMKVMIDFYDNTNITFDNYDNFINVFYNRISEIKSLDVYYSLNYTVVQPEPNRSRKSYMQSIKMYIRENKMDITLNLNSEDPKLDELFQMIKSTILNAPEKYDWVIKKKQKITNTVAFSLGMIPSLILMTILLFISPINSLFLSGYVIYPIGALILAYGIGILIVGLFLDRYYAPIMPEKKYAGYHDGKMTYKDDVEKFVESSEILIGKKVNNLACREQIRNTYEKFKKLIPIELLVLGVISIIVIIVGQFM